MARTSIGRRGRLVRMSWDADCRGGADLMGGRRVEIAVEIRPEQTRTYVDEYSRAGAESSECDKV